MWKNNTIEIIDIELTSYCNIKCPGCLRQQSAAVSPLLNTEFIKLKRLTKWLTLKNFPNIKFIIFCGSVDEPTSHPEFFDIIDYCKLLNVHIAIATNGSIRTETWWGRLGNKLKKSSHSVKFGIDGLNGISEKYRVGSSYSKVQQNYRAFIAAGGKATWQFIVFDWNKHQLKEAEEYSKKEGFAGFRAIYSHRKTSGETKTENITESTTIKCAYMKQNRIFINHKESLIPCCHLNSETLQMAANASPKSDYGSLYENHGKELCSSLKYNTVEEILEGDYFKDIVSSWDTDTPLTKCYKTCKQKEQDIFHDIRWK